MHDRPTPVSCNGDLNKFLKHDLPVRMSKGAQRFKKQPPTPRARASAACAAAARLSDSPLARPGSTAVLGWNWLWYGIAWRRGRSVGLHGLEVLRTEWIDAHGGAHVHMPWWKCALFPAVVWCDGRGRDTHGKNLTRTEPTSQCSTPNIPFRYRLIVSWCHKLKINLQS